MTAPPTPFRPETARYTMTDDETTTLECKNCGREYEVENPERYATDEPCVKCRDDDKRAV